MLSILHVLQEEFQKTIRELEPNTPRIYHFPEAKNMIKVAMGMRRSGKTFFLFQTVRQLLLEEVPIDRILYINFEDDRILPMDYKAMGQMIDGWYTLHPQNHNQCCYLFLDEVQNVVEWPVVLRRMLDTKNLQIYVTGSSAKLLSKEIATSLRGRSLAIEVLPYDYTEYLAAHQLALSVEPFGKQARDFHRSYLLDYFRLGGFPAVQAMSDKERRETLQNYVETVVLRDIVERYQISNIALLKYFIRSLLKNVASPFSINKFYNDIKSQGYRLGKDTLYSYLSYIEDAFLVFSVPVFTESLRHRQTTPKKIYSIDNGLTVASTFNLSENWGKLLENQVYLDLRRQGKKVFYYQTSDGYEVDFITQDEHGRYEIIQVVWDVEDARTLEREMRALEQAQKELGLPGKIVDCSAYLQGFVKKKAET